MLGHHQNGKRREYDGQLPDFHTHVEADQGAPELPGRQAELAEEASETEPVQQPEPEHDNGSPFGHVTNPHIFDRYDGNAGSDQRLHDARGWRYDAGTRQTERDRVRERERRDLVDEWPQSRRGQHERHHEQDVIEPARQDVVDADLHVKRKGRHRAARLACFVEQWLNLAHRVVAGAIHGGKLLAQQRVHTTVARDTEFVFGMRRCRRGNHACCEQHGQRGEQSRRARLCHIRGVHWR